MTEAESHGLAFFGFCSFPSVLLCSCCECTCDPGEHVDDDWRCGPSAGYACVDPEAACVDDDSVTIDMLEVCHYPSGIGEASTFLVPEVLRSTRRVN